MADLEADVDNPDEEPWEDLEADELSKLETNTADSRPAMRENDQLNEDLAATASRLLSIRNSTDELSNETQSEPPNLTLNSGETPSLLSRRNARHETPPPDILGNNASLSLGSIHEQPSSIADLLRPITPTQPLLDDLTPNTEAGSTGHAMEMLTDGVNSPTLFPPSSPPGSFSPN